MTDANAPLDHFVSFKPLETRQAENREVCKTEPGAI